MASQNEVHSESGNEKTEKGDRESTAEKGGSVDLETKDKQPAPFSEFDPFRATRTSTLVGETSALLEQVHLEPSFSEGTDEAMLRKLYADAEERSMWSETRSDAFLSVLRLGIPTPPRGKRIL